MYNSSTLIRAFHNVHSHNVVISRIFALHWDYKGVDRLFRFHWTTSSDVLQSSWSFSRSFRRMQTVWTVSTIYIAAEFACYYHFSSGLIQTPQLSLESIIKSFESTRRPDSLKPRLKVIDEIDLIEQANWSSQDSFWTKQFTMNPSPCSLNPNGLLKTLKGLSSTFCLFDDKVPSVCV